jgi:phenylalanine-4-hydroxylase
MTTPRSLLLTIPHKVGTLKKCLDVLSRFDINLSRIQSKPAPGSARVKYEFVVDVDENVSANKLQEAIQYLNRTPDVCEKVTFLGSEKIPWFPRHISDIDYFSKQTLDAGSDLQSDHPGFSDPVYRERREMITEIAQSYKHGSPIPYVKYTKQEKETWKLIYNKLMSFYPKHACEQVNFIMPLLQQNCGYSENNVPQLEDISQFLTETTGFRLRPVSGLLSARDFLNGLAFRVFHSTQYLRHHSVPLYTPEPDIVHELMGHAPLFADADFAEFSQEIGLASLGATDEDIKKLGTLYWFTVEYGVCKQHGQRKAYGAGLLSSFGELEYSMDQHEQKPKILPFEPERACNQEYPITTYQPLYFEAESFEIAKEQMRKYATKLQRPFAVRYNPYTMSVEVLDNHKKLAAITSSIQSQLDVLKSATEKLNRLGDGHSLLEFQRLERQQMDEKRNIDYRYRED